MAALPPYLSAVPDGVEILLHVQPRASRTCFQGEHGGRLKVSLAAPPVDGAANEALVRFLADVLGVPRRQVEIVSGASGRQKRARIRGIDAARAEARLRAHP